MQRGKDIAVKFPGLFIVHHNIPGSIVPSHAHAEHHLIIPLQGEVSVEMNTKSNEKALSCGPGRMVYVSPHTDHSFRSAAQKGERLICMIDAGVWKKADGGSFGSRLLPASQLCKELLFFLLLNPKSKNATALIDAFARTVIELLEVPSKELFSVDHAEGSLSRPELKKAVSIARENFSTDFSVAEMARRSGLSTRNLTRLFQTELGVTPKQLLMSLRIEKAKEHLQSGMTVTETAYEVGYSSLSQFIQSFRQFTGSIPSEFSPYK